MCKKTASGKLLVLIIAITGCQKQETIPITQNQSTERNNGTDCHITLYNGGSKIGSWESRGKFVTGYRSSYMQFFSSTGDRISFTGTWVATQPASNTEWETRLFRTDPSYYIKLYSGGGEIGNWKSAGSFIVNQFDSWITFLDSETDFKINVNGTWVATRPSDATKDQELLTGQAHRINLYDGGSKIGSWESIGNYTVSYGTYEDWIAFVDMATNKKIMLNGTWIATIAHQ